MLSTLTATRRGRNSKSTSWRTGTGGVSRDWLVWIICSTAVSVFESDPRHQLLPATITSGRGRGVRVRGHFRLRNHWSASNDINHTTGMSKVNIMHRCGCAINLSAVHTKHLQEKEKESGAGA